MARVPPSQWTSAAAEQPNSVAMVSRVHFRFVRMARSSVPVMGKILPQNLSIGKRFCLTFYPMDVL
jgi:hypothetical protein